MTTKVPFAVLVGTDIYIVICTVIYTVICTVIGFWFGQMRSSRDTSETFARSQSYTAHPRE